jgi:hypothetical protein
VHRFLALGLVGCLSSAQVDPPRQPWRPEDGEVVCGGYGYAAAATAIAVGAFAGSVAVVEVGGNPGSLDEVVGRVGASMGLATVGIVELVDAVIAFRDAHRCEAFRTRPGRVFAKWRE